MELPDIVVGIGGLGGVLVGLYALSRATATVGRRVGRSEQRQKTLTVYARIGVLAVGIALAWTLYTMYPVFEPIVAVLEPDGWWIGRPLGHGVGLGVVALAAIWAVKRGTDPTIEDVLDQQHTVPARYRRRLWTAHALFVVGTPVVLLTLYAAGFGSVWTVVAFYVLVLCWFVLRTPLVSFAYRTRDPTAEERSRLERCFDRFGREPPTVVVFDDRHENLDVKLVGHSAYRTLWIQESLLSSTDEAELAAILGAEDEKNRRYFYEQCYLAVAPVLFMVTALILILGELLFVSEFTVDSASTLVWFTSIGFAFVGILAVSQTSRWTIYRADRFVSSHVDPDVVRRAYDRYAQTITTIDQEQTRSGLSKRLTIEPPMEQRIRRLERANSLEPMPRTAREPESSEVETPAEAAGSNGTVASDDVEPTPNAPPADWDSREHHPIQQALASIDRREFADVVARLRGEFGRECTVAEADESDWIDVVARSTDGTTELLRTVHRRTDDPVTPDEITDERGRIVSGRSVETVLVVTNGRFDDRVDRLAADLTLVDGQRLTELLEDSALADELGASAAE
ncbi:restriction endonuclease [Natrarchaeobaculum aegyptiacum]|uniref:Restriction endonuclease type IV Mrr domain-containing protein n=1 Tax=Natrarchaeobaculum aegyptiacum TaxID=745377 RepID=A0A2Z2HRL0_9EURY|nr:restriction endonuclease [Natrarchaeobaculum aegyptiacum]ARS88705.1 hypothetical protein B1756_02325 [Natrarchaeobaculum aegyptiacum]